jgi:hypothetical protein
MLKDNPESGPNGDKGSYRHMLDLVTASNFREVMSDLLAGTDASLADTDFRHPCGRSRKEDRAEVKLEDYLKRYPVLGYSGLDRRWWIAFKGSRPTWDLVCHINMAGKPGLLLVEAKAHFSEMGEKNKKSAADPENDRSIANDLSIRLRLAEASLRLTELGLGGFRLSADHEYQLSNRLAYLQKLASDGIPTVLMYLGWLTSPDWPNDAFPDGTEWEKCVTSHMSKIGPDSFVGPRHHIGAGATSQMIIRSIAPDVLIGAP